MVLRNYNIITGTNFNDTLHNESDSGLTVMLGKAGNDKYIIDNIQSTVSEIEDTKGTEKLYIDNIKTNDLAFFFDIAVSDSQNQHPSDELFIIKSNMINDFYSQLKGYLQDPDSFTKYLKNGIVSIDYFMGNTNNVQSDGNLGTTYGNGLIEEIYARNNTSSECKIDIKKYLAAAAPKVLAFLQEKGYNSSAEVILNGDETLVKQLFAVYKSVPINSIIQGTKKDDKLYGNTGNDKIYGKNGDDTINGNAGNDSIKGGNDDDSISGNSGKDTLLGENGNDTIKAGLGNDSIVGGKGNDKIYFQRGNNIASFANGHGKDTIYSGKDSDTIRFASISNTDDIKSKVTVKKSNNDLILNYTSKDKITLKNYYKTGTSVDKLMAKNKKSITLEEFLDSAIFNTFSGKRGKKNNIKGTSLNDAIFGNNKRDTLNGADGNDQIYGKGGDDSILGGNGNDYLDGDTGHDTIKGGNGNDTIYGNSGDDYIEGGRGSDYIDGGIGNDSIYGNSGNNTLIGGTGKDRITSKNGNDYIDAGTGDDTISVENGNNTIKGGTGDDLIIIKGGSSNIDGGSGNDTIAGMGDVNIIKNSSGDDKYYSYINRTTEITDKLGTDELQIRNNTDTTDANHSNLHIVFNLNADSSNIVEDSLMILNDENFTKWQTNIYDSTIKGINIKGNNIKSIETIKASDGFELTSSVLDELQASILGWLNSNSKGSVAQVINGTDQTAKESLIAAFVNNTNWL